MSDSLIFRLLQYVRESAVTLNFTRAAERAFVVQSSLSYQIGKFESNINLTLFERTQCGLKLTTAGRLIAAYAETTLKEWDQTLVMARAVQMHQVPPLRLGFSSFVHANVIEEFHRSYEEMFSGCAMQLKSGDPVYCLEHLDAGLIDCAILPLPIDANRYIVQPISHSPLAVCMRSDDPLAARGQLDIRDVAPRVTVFRDPDQYSYAHARLVEMFAEAQRLSQINGKEFRKLQQKGSLQSCNSRCKIALRAPDTSMNQDLITPVGYDELLQELKAHIREAQVRAAMAVSRELVLLHWTIGREISRRFKQQGWGTKIVDRLARDLQESFPGVDGFSPRNLRYIRSLAEAWPEPEILQQLIAKLPWGHNIRVLDKIKDRPTREWYLRAALEYGWSQNVLSLQIDTRLHEREGKALTNFSRTLPALGSDLAEQVLKDRTTSTSLPWPGTPRRGRSSAACCFTSGICSSS